MTNGEDVHTPGFTKIEIEFYFIAISMDNTKEDFWVQYFDGTIWRTVATFTKGIDFDNGVFYVATVNIFETDYSFPNNMKIRFMCDASGNRDDVYIDDIRITASIELVPNANLKIVDYLSYVKSSPFEIEDDEMTIYPNPAQDKLNIALPGAEEVQVYIYSATGQLMYEGKEVYVQESINISDLEKGLKDPVIDLQPTAIAKQLPGLALH